MDEFSGSRLRGTGAESRERDVRVLRGAVIVLRHYSRRPDSLGCRVLCRVVSRVADKIGRGEL